MRVVSYLFPGTGLAISQKPAHDFMSQYMPVLLGRDHCTGTNYSHVGGRPYRWEWD